MVTEEYAAVCKSLDITNSDTYEYKNKKISKYYIYNVDTVMAQYYYEPTGRFGPNGMVSIKKEHTTDYKARITIIDYKGRYYVAVMCVLEHNYNKNSFKAYKEVIKSIKPNT